MYLKKKKYKLHIINVNKYKLLNKVCDRTSESKMKVLHTNHLV